jgi:delta-aminolevulinic acid dehydratase/porphobilinogen synthase
VVNSSLTKVGTLTSGTWNAGVISVAYGGTGVNTITGIIKGNSQAAFSAAVAGTDYLAPSSIIDGGTF